MILKAVIIEDENIGREALKNLLARFCTDVRVVGEAITVQQGVDIIKNEKPDIVFLDIELPQENGFALLEYYPEPDFAIIFTTAYDDYAIQAFRISAVDYLLKPIDFQLLQKAVEKVKSKLNQSQRKASLQVLTNNIKSESSGKIALPVSNGLVFIELDDIVYCKADRNYTISCIIHLL